MLVCLADLLGLGCPLYQGIVDGARSGPVSEPAIDELGLGSACGDVSDEGFDERRVKRTPEE